MTEPSTLFYMAMTTMSLSVFFAYTQLVAAKRELVKLRAERSSK